MNNEITVTAKTYDDAIMEAQMQLQSTVEHMVVEVVEEGKSGFLGIGGKSWVIKAREMSEEEIEAKERGELKSAEKHEEKREEKHDEKHEKKHNKKHDKPRSEREPKKEESHASGNESTSSTKSEERIVPRRNPIVPVSEAEAAELVKKATDFLSEILKGMQVESALDAKFGHEENEIAIDISGPDMGALIGKRGQTLDSLQYLTSLVVNRDTNGYIRIKLDTENYRERRKEKLEKFARNMAAKARKTRRTVSLEPMNPYERRIIHAAIQHERNVTTYSEGEEPYRYIVISPRRVR